MPHAGREAFQGFETIEKFEADLIAEGLITHDQLSIARISKENLGLDLATVLLKKGFVTDDQLLKFVAKKTHIPFITLKDFQLDPELMGRLPMHLAKQHLSIIISQKGEKMAVAMANPFDTFLIDDLGEILNAEIEPHLASQQEIEDTLSRFYEDQRYDENKILSSIEISTESSGESEEQKRKMQEMALGPKIVATVNNLIAKAHAERASDIHIEPARRQVIVRFRVDGLLREVAKFGRDLHLPIVSRIKILGGLDIAERRVPQDGRVRVLLVGKPLDMRISTCPTQHGEKIVIRLLSKDEVTSIESLGFDDKERRLFSDIISKSHGIFLSTGPTGSGKSTTLYAALSRLNSVEKNIISIEDPIENEIIGVNQVAVNTKAGLTFAAVLRSVLRQDPDVIMLGEIRDGETAQIAVRAAITGHMVLSTLHTNTAAGAISRLEDLGVEPFLIASALKGVMAQRLVRRICTHCREEGKPAKAALDVLSMPIAKVFSGKGCKKCHYTGYSGRMGIFELAPIDETICNLIHDRAGDNAIVQAFRKMGVKSIVKDGVEKAQKGLTTLEEVIRVTQEE